jgi:hypothetical protein
MAGDPKPLCVFCEDGVPCPNRQRVARPAVTTTSAPITPLVPQKPGRPKNPNSPWRGNAGLHLSDKAPAKPATTNSAVTLQDGGLQPQQIVEVPTAGKDRQEKKEITVKPTPDDDNIPRYCGRDGCTKTLTRANKSGFCTKHFYDSKKSGRAPGRPATNGKAAAPRGSKATPPRNPPARVETPENGIATICVTEDNLNSFWMKLSLEEKANLFQRQLEGA